MLNAASVACTLATVIRFHAVARLEVSDPRAPRSRWYATDTGAVSGRGSTNAREPSLSSAGSTPAAWQYCERSRPARSVTPNRENGTQARRRAGHVTGAEPYPGSHLINELLVESSRHRVELIDRDLSSPRCSSSLPEIRHRPRGRRL